MADQNESPHKRELDWLTGFANENGSSAALVLAADTITKLRDGRRGGETLRSLFHNCWTAAVDSPSYDKRVWQELASELRKLGIEVQ